MAQTDQERQDGLVALTVVLTVFSTFTVAVRSLVRFILMHNLGIDDVMMIAAMTLTLGYMAEILVARSNGIGFAATTLGFDQMVSLLKVALAVEVVYTVIVALIKISILFMYLRFAVTKTFRHLCYATIVFHVVFTIICVGLAIWQCQPVEKLWDLTGTVNGQCIDTTAFFYSTSGINIVTDIWIIALPVKTLNGLRRPLRDKIALGFIFGAGIFAAVMSVVRLNSIYTYTLSADKFRDAIAVNVWSEIEVNVAILCASVPALKPLFTPSRLRQLRKPAPYEHSGSDRPTGSSSYGGSSSKKSASSRGAPDPFALSEDRSTPSPVGKYQPDGSREDEDIVWLQSLSSPVKSKGPPSSSGDSEVTLSMPKQEEVDAIQHV